MWQEHVLARQSNKMGAFEASMRMPAASARLSRADYLSRRSEAPMHNSDRQRTAYHQGWLQKKAIGRSRSTLIRTWRARYFVLLDRELRWYESAEVDKATGNSHIKGHQKGKLPITAETAIEHDAQLSSRSCSFTITSKGTSLHLQAKDVAQRNAWIAALGSRTGGRRPVNADAEAAIGGREPAISLTTLDMETSEHIEEGDAEDGSSAEEDD